MLAYIVVARFRCFASSYKTSTLNKRISYVNTRLVQQYWHL